MRPFVVHESEVPESEGRYPPPFDAEGLSFGRDLGRAAGSTAVGAWVERLPAGRRTSRTHAHLREEELVYVLAGAPVLHWRPVGGDAHEEPLRAGSFVAFPAGTGLAHHLHNPGPDEARLLVVGERRDDDRVHYPEDPALEAWRAETRPARCWSDVAAPHPDAAPPAWRIRSARVELRPWRLEDVPAMAAAIARDQARLAEWMSWARFPADLDDHANRVLQWSAAFGRREDYVYGIFRDGAPIGGTGLHPRVGPRAYEIGYWLAGAHEGQGIMAECVRAVARVAFAVHGADRVEIHMDPRNLRSAAVPRRLGFTHEATLRRRIPDGDVLADAMVWTLYREEADRLGDEPLAAWDRLERRLL